MLAKRHLLVLAFAGGCLSGATTIGLWFGVGKPTPRDATLARAAQRLPEPAYAAPIVHDPQSALVADDDDAMDDEPLVPQKTADTDAGNSLAEVLLRLEAAYRLGLAATSPQAATAIPQPPVPEAAAHQVTAVAVVTPPAPPTIAPPMNPPAAEAPAARAAEVETPQRVATRDDVQPRDVYNDKVQQNTNVGSAHQGDVYFIQNAVPYYAVPYVSRSQFRSQSPSPYGVPVRRAPSNPAGSGSFDYPIDGVFKYPIELVH